MDSYMTLILLFFEFSFSSCFQHPWRWYYYLDLRMTWADAQLYCREHYTDLATFESMDDINRLSPDFSYSMCWIGLSDDPASWKNVEGNDTNSWRWSVTGETTKTGYLNWRWNEPNNAFSIENCALMVTDGVWGDDNCDRPLYFYCYTANNQNEKTYVLISEFKTWHDAQAYCREHYTDLAIIDNSEENSRAYSLQVFWYEVWIGLYRVPWTWSDKAESSFKNWQWNNPDNFFGSQFCVVEDASHEWGDENCDTELPFICHQVTRLKTMVRMTIQADVDLTDPAINTQFLQQLTETLTSQGWTDFNLQWRIQPRKRVEETEEFTETDCP